MMIQQRPALAVAAGGGPTAQADSAMRNLLLGILTNHLELDDKRGISFALGSIGNVYYVQTNYPKALEYMQKELEIHEEMNNLAAYAGVWVI